MSPFINEELLTIFSGGYAKFMNKPRFYWIPILGSYLGARLDELARI